MSYAAAHQQARHATHWRDAGRSPASYTARQTPRQDWSGRIASPERSGASHMAAQAAESTSPVCWVCSKPCTSYGWCQANSTMVHRITFYPASLFALCATCAKAIALAPGTSLVDVVRMCHPTAATRAHSHAFVAFLREYLVTLEAIYLDLEEASDAQRLSTSTPLARHRATTPTRAGGVPGGTGRRREVRRDAVPLSARHVDMLTRCIGDALSDREALTLKEVHLLMNEAAALQVQAEMVGHRPQYAAHGPLSPEQRVMRQHPLLAVNTAAREAPLPHSFYGSAAPVATPAGHSRHYDAAPTTPVHGHSTPAYGRQPQHHGEGEHRSIVVDGRTYVLADSAAESQPSHAPRYEEPAPAAAAPSTNRTSPPQQHATASPARNPTTAGGRPSQRLLAAAEEFANREQAYEAERELWHAEREELHTHVATLENEVKILRERMRVKDNESDKLVVKNTQLAERLATVDTVSTLQAHLRLMNLHMRNSANMVADAAAQKAKLLADSALHTLRTSVATARQLQKTKEELDATKLHLKQQQKLLEASRKSVMQAWSDTAGLQSQGQPAQQPPRPYVPASRADDDDGGTTMF